MIWAMAFPEWICSSRTCRRYVRWADAAFDEDDGRLYGVYHLHCVGES